MQLAALLVTVDGTKLGHPKRQVLVRPWERFIYLAVMRAVHWLEQEFLALLGSLDGLERVLAIFLVVPRRDVKLFMSDMRGDDRVVIELPLDLLQEVFEARPQL